jgi:hypothetical protein
MVVEVPNMKWHRLGDAGSWYAEKAAIGDGDLSIG